MPTSQPGHISWLCQEIIQMGPQSILDIGVGFGSKGVLFREYTDIRWLRYNKKDWQTRIDGIEIFEEYRNAVWQTYNNIYIGDAYNIIDKLGYYDLIYLGDVIEHFGKEKGIKFLNKLFKKCKVIIIATPLKVKKQGVVLGNKYEIHKSQWSKEDFKDFHWVKKAHIKGEAERIIYNNILVIKLNV